MKVLYRLFVVVLALIVIVSGLPPVEAQLSDGPMTTPNLQPFRLGNTQEARDLRNQKPNDKKTLEDILPKITASNYDLAVEIASIPEHIRGYGHVKDEHLKKAKEAEARLLEKFCGGTPCVEHKKAA